MPQPKRMPQPRRHSTRRDAGAAEPATTTDADAATDASTTVDSSGRRIDAGLRVVPVKHWGRWVLSAIVAFVILQFLWSLATNPQWQWDVFAEYFFAPSVINGLWLTLALTVVSGAVGFVLGAVLAVFRLSKSALLNAAAWWYIWFFRSVPLVVQILVWYNLGYLYPTLGLGTPFTTDFWLVEFPTTTLICAFAAATIGLSLHQAAYSAEIIRAGILSVDQGQLEAAGALGLPRRIRFFRITLPQAARAIVPNAFNEIIGLVKGTSVVFIVALPELFYTVQVIYNRNQRVIPLLLVAVVWYALITTVLSIAQYYVERRFARGALRELPPTPVQRAKAWVRTQWERLGDAPAGGPPAPRVDARARGSRRSRDIRRCRTRHDPHRRCRMTTTTLTPSFDEHYVPTRKVATVGRVEITDVSKSYGANQVLRDVSLTIEPGQVVVLIGPSGSGKSTLLRTINHLETVDRGSITVDGQYIGYERKGDTLHELREAEILRRRTQVGLVFQNFNLFPHLTAIENVIEAPIAHKRLTKQDARALAEGLLARVGLADKADHYPRQLSGGQQQRVAIARALALSPKVLLFDEPTSALDPELVGEVLDVIRGLARDGTTLVIVTHEIGFAREVADRIVFLDHGEIVEQGTPGQVLRNARHRRTRDFLAKVL